LHFFARKTDKGRNGEDGKKDLLVNWILKLENKHSERKCIA